MWVRNAGHTRRSAMLDSAAAHMLSTSQVVFVDRKPRPAAHPCLSSGEDAQRRYISTFSLLPTRKCVPYCSVETHILHRLPASVMHARYQSRKSITSAREACRRTTSVQRTSALLPSLLESIPEDPENPTVVRHTGGRDATASDQTCVETISPGAATDAQQRSTAGPLLGAGRVCSPC
jgi:hypothetical protein